MPPGQRLALVDVLRGFALFGIIQINLPAFLVGADPLFALLRIHGAPTDWIAFALNAFFAEAKFYPLFAFLFGYGFALQWRSLTVRGLAPYRFLLRRYGSLLVLGVLHGTLVFFGDILTMYASAGLMLLATRQPERRLARRLLAVWLLLALVLLGLQVAGSWATPGEDLSAALVDELRVSLAQLSEGPFWEPALERAQLYGSAQLYQLGGFLPQLLFLMGLGAYAARMGVLRRPARFPGLWRRCMQIGLLAGIPINLALAALQIGLAMPGVTAPGLSRAGMALALDALYPFAATLTLAYVAAIVYASRRARAWRVSSFVLGVLAKLGRLALTNYLMQSLFMVLLFTNLGLGLASRLGPAALAGTGVLVCLLQAALALAYLRRYSIGPAEGAWRRWVYGPLEPVAKDANGPNA